MKITIIHISDIHAKRGSNFHLFVDPVCELLENRKSDKLLLALSGDVANSGDKPEYDAVAFFINKLRQAVTQKGFPSLDVIAVPGNHDLHYEEGFVRSREDTCCSTDKLFKDALKKDVGRLANYYEFEKENCLPADEKSACLHLYTFDAGDRKIVFYAINNAISSTYKGTTNDDIQCGSRGLIHITHEVFNDISFQPDAYCFCLFHFPPTYFDTQTSDCFREKMHALKGCFFGHIHTEDDSIINTDGCSCQLSAVGAFNNAGTSSELALIDLDFGEDTITRTSFRFDFESHRYFPSAEAIVGSLGSMAHESGLSPSSSFVDEEIDDDPLQLFEGSHLSDYYVFPELSLREYSQTMKPQESRVSSYKEFIAKIRGAKCVSVFGSCSGGRSSFLKTLFTLLQNGYLPVYAKSDVFVGSTGNSFRKKINVLLAEQYQDHGSDLFDQEPMKFRFLLLDDADKLGDQKNQILVAASKEFGTVITTNYHDPLLGIESIVDDMQSIFSNGETYSFKILPFYFEKRKELSEKTYLALSKNEGFARSEKECRSFCSSVNSVFEKFMGPSSSQPGFLVLTCQALYKSAKSVGISSSIYNDVFRSHITSIISNATRSDSTYIDLFQQLLNRLAYSVSKSPKYSISSADALEIITKYEKNYEISGFDSVRFLNMMVSAKILACHDENYSFTSKDNLAFFAAQEYSRLLTTDYSSNKDSIIFLLEHVFTGINSSILLFIAFGAAPNVIDLLLESAQKTTAAIKEVDFTEFPLFKKVQKEMQNLVPFSGEDVKQISASRSATERTQDLCEQRAYTEEVKKGFEKKYDERQESILSVSAYLSLLTAIIPDFKTRMLADRQHQCVSLIYSLSNKLLTLSFDLDDEFIKHFVEEMQVFLSDKLKRKSITEEAVFSWIVDMIRACVLSCYHFAASRSITSLTAPILCDPQYEDTPCHMIERLMMMSFGNCGDAFKANATKLFDASKDKPLIRDCIRLIVRRFVYDNNGFEFHGSEQSFVDHFFIGYREKKDLFVTNQKNSTNKRK